LTERKALGLKNYYYLSSEKGKLAEVNLQMAVKIEILQNKQSL